MVEEVSLRVGINAEAAKAGADSFKRSAAEIVRSAEKLGRSVEKAGGGFDKMKKAANDNSRALAQTAQSLRDVETTVNGLSRSAGDGVRPLTESLSGLCEKLDVSKKQTNGLATAFDLLGAAADIIEIVEFLRRIKRIQTAFKTLVTVIGSARLAIGGFFTAIVSSPLTVPIAALAALGGGIVLLGAAMTRGERAQRAINDAMARGAKRGAAEFSRAADDIKKKAADMSRAVERSSRAFRNMRNVRNGNSNSLSSTNQSIFSGTIEGGETILDERRPFIIDAVGLATDIFERKLEKERRKNEVARLTKSADNAAKEQIAPRAATVPPTALASRNAPSKANPTRCTSARHLWSARTSRCACQCAGSRG